MPTLSMESSATVLLLNGSLPSTFKIRPWPKPSPSLKFQISTSTISPSLKFPLYPVPPPSGHSSIRPRYELRSTIEEEVAVESNSPKQTVDLNQRKKLYVVNLPRTLSAVDLKNTFSQCGTVKHIEIVKDENGRKRGYAFVTMASGEEADAVVNKFNSTELSGRTIKVEYAKKFKPPHSPAPALASPSSPVEETRHKLYVSNLQWKVRAGHLREFFSADFNPVSARVVFDSPLARPAGYGFVSFATREEAKAALSSLNGKELLGRPVRLNLNEKKSSESENDGEEKDTSTEYSGEPVEEKTKQL
ncbi:hypothetical protein Nepgr_031641 [Nepenthes gracilis]|uniref:RRM domain-containing protein n=1 Tax=Nepenthes gracilis TaxID=150966 RepID=A0AAD3TIV6_NEPGR|nr:hypothetical protein Nepgr_031641 [Nepenthes gracilis]